jgi:regulator of protease activity HflC (stomatin/prohibitin superfamily)
MAKEIIDIKTSSSKLTEQTALMLGGLNLVLAVAGFFLARWLPANGILGIAFLNILTFFTSLLAFLHARVERLAAEEILANRNIGGKGGELFSNGSENEGDKVRVWRQFEKWFVSFFTLVIIAMEAAGAFYLSSRLPFSLKSPVESPNFQLGIPLAMGVAAFILFLTGKYAAGLAYKGKRRHLRAPASQSIFTAFFSLLMIIALLVSRFAISSESSKWRNPEPFMLYAGVVVLAAFAISGILGFVFSYYRPRTDGRMPLPLYENRLAGLFAQPEGAWQNIAEMLDYQFGFKISETRFYSFCLKAVLPFLLFQLATLLLISCVIVVPAGQRAFRERLGGMVGEPLEPGLHLKLPWPLESVYYSPADLELSFNFGSYPETAGTEPKNNLWNNLPEKMPLFITAVSGKSPGKVPKDQADDQAPRLRVPVVNLITARVQMQYFVNNAKDYYYGHIDPQALLKKLALRELTAYLATHDGLELLKGSGKEFNLAIIKNLNKASADLRMGIEITSVAIIRIQPPTDKGTAATFHKTMIEEQKSKTLIFNAEKYRNKIIPEAKTEGQKLVIEAGSYEAGKVAGAKAATEVFRARYKLYNKYHGLYSRLAYLETVRKALKVPRKIIMAVENKDQVLSFDLKNEFNPELLDMAGSEGTK